MTILLIVSNSCLTECNQNYCSEYPGSQRFLLSFKPLVILILTQGTGRKKNRWRASSQNTTVKNALALEQHFPAWASLGSTEKHYTSHFLMSQLHKTTEETHNTIEKRQERCLDLCKSKKKGKKKNTMNTKIRKKLKYANKECQKHPLKCNQEKHLTGRNYNVLSISIHS